MDRPHRLTQLLFVIGLFLAVGCFLLAAPSPRPVSAQTDKPLSSAQAVGISRASRPEWVVLAWNDLGMHCYNSSFKNLAVLPPYNTLWAQVIKVGDPPQIVTQGITVTYAFPNNSYSVSPGVKKTDFWDYAKQLFGASLAPNIGLKGKGLAGSFDVMGDHFAAEGIPLTEYSDSNPTQPDYYQMATVIVHDASTGAELARTVTVAPVSSEMHCDNCHHDGGVEGISTGNVETNILVLHDKEHQSEYPAKYAGPLMNQRPVLCAKCHGSNALGMAGEPGIPSLSKAMHAKHAEGGGGDDGGGGGGDSALNVALNAALGKAMPSNYCYNCHPGPKTQCLRDVMSQRGMTCTNCHGDMQHVAANPHPWLNEPRCDSCHTDPKYKQNNALYRFSTGHGGVYCEGCHDSTHAIAPSSQPKDGIKFIDWQGHTGTLSTCTVCHATNPVGAGPHGMMNTATPTATPALTPDPSTTALPTPTVLPTTTPAASPTPSATSTPTPLPAAPVLNALAPNQGLSTIPNEVRILGSGLQPNMLVTIDGVPLKEVNVSQANATAAAAIVPAGIAPGVYDVVAQNPGSATATLVNGYTVLDPAGEDYAADDSDLWFDPVTVRRGREILTGVNVHHFGVTSGITVTVDFYLGDPAQGGVPLGRANTPPLPAGSDIVDSALITWTPTAEGQFTVTAVIDPDNVLTETNKANNIARWIITVASPDAADTTPPTINTFSVNGGAQITEDRNVGAIVAADDNGGEGSVKALYLAERVFNSSARQWIALQQTGWIPYSAAFTLTLSTTGGARYLQAWVADAAGNVSTAAYRTRINYLPVNDALQVGQVRVYRVALSAGQTLTADLATLRGDADLYVWAPDGKTKWVSNHYDLAPESLIVVAPQDGDYQVEVVAYLDSTYHLSLGTAPVGRTAAGPTVTSKLQRSEPVVDITSAPPGQQALPSALVWKAFLPVTVR